MCLSADNTKPSKKIGKQCLDSLFHQLVFLILSLMLNFKILGVYKYSRLPISSERAQRQEVSPQAVLG